MPDAKDKNGRPVSKALVLALPEDLERLQLFLVLGYRIAPGRRRCRIA